MSQIGRLEVRMSVTLFTPPYPPLYCPWWGYIRLNFWLFTQYVYSIRAKTRLIRTKRDKVGEILAGNKKPRYF